MENKKPPAQIGAEAEIELQSIFKERGYVLKRGGYPCGKSPDLYGLPGVHIEVKCRKQFDPCTWLEQSRRDAQKYRDGVPHVFFRKNDTWLVLLAVDDWMELYKKAYSEELSRMSTAIYDPKAAEQTAKELYMDLRRAREKDAGKRKRYSLLKSTSKAKHKTESQTQNSIRELLPLQGTGKTKSFQEQRGQNETFKSKSGIAPGRTRRARRGHNPQAY